MMDQRSAFDATVELAREHDMEAFGEPGPDALSFEHLLDMQARITPEFSEAKLGRWLGWAQAALVAANVGVTLDDVKALNLAHQAESHPMTPADEATVEAVAAVIFRNASVTRDWSECIAKDAITAYESARSPQATTGDVKPTRVQLAHRLFEADCYGLQPDDWERLNPGQWDSYFRMADAILALLPGRPEAVIKAEALREFVALINPEPLYELSAESAVDGLLGFMAEHATALENGANDES